MFVFSFCQYFVDHFAGLSFVAENKLTTVSDSAFIDGFSEHFATYSSVWVFPFRNILDRFDTVSVFADYIQFDSGFMRSADFPVKAALIVR